MLYSSITWVFPFTTYTLQLREKVPQSCRNAFDFCFYFELKLTWSIKSSRSTHYAECISHNWILMINTWIAVSLPLGERAQQSVYTRTVSWWSVQMQDDGCVETLYSFSFLQVGLTSGPQGHTHSVTWIRPKRHEHTFILLNPVWLLSAKLIFIYFFVLFS